MTVIEDLSRALGEDTNEIWDRDEEGQLRDRREGGTGRRESDIREQQEQEEDIREQERDKRESDDA
jgi:hypothetical protein